MTDKSKTFSNINCSKHKLDKKIVFKSSVERYKYEEVPGSKTEFIKKESNSDRTSDNESCGFQSNKNKIKRSVKYIPIPEFPVEWETNILDLISQKDKHCHSSALSIILQEIKEMFMKDMQNFAVNILSSTVKSFFISKNFVQYEIRSKEAFICVTFVKCYKSIARRYFLSHSVIRCIVETAYFKLPRIICNFSHYYQFGVITIQSLQTMISKDIRKGTLAIANQFHAEIAKTVSVSNILRNFSGKQLAQFIKCMTNVFVQQIVNVMMSSVDHIINCMENGCCCPQIELQLICKDGQLIVEPAVEEIFLIYHNVLESIETIAQALIPLEEWLGMDTNYEYIKVQLPDWFIEESHEKLQNIMVELYKPIQDHLLDIQKEFSGVYGSRIRSKILQLTVEEANFNLHLRNIEKYNMYYKKANAMVSHMYYKVGKLDQRVAKECLENYFFEITDTLTKGLIEYHQEYNKSICSEFEKIKSRALDVPKDAKLLIELTEYISRASKVLTKELEQRIRKSIQMLSSLLEITVLTEEHISLNSETINWLKLIKPIFVQNNTLCEAMKNELEDDLQRRINNLNSEVEEIFPTLVVLDDMDDVTRIQEYMEHYRDLLKKVEYISNQVEEINTEEKLFRFPETLFPKVTELKETILPFYSLIRTIRLWQRDNAVWLDGPFEFLDSSVIETKTLKYFEEITEMSRTFKARIKMDVTSNKSFKFTGIADDPDPMQQPAPLKLCWQALKEINEFKVYLPLAVCMCNSALENRHWKEMSAIAGFDLTPNAGTTLRKIIDCNLMNDIEKYEVISVGANKELALRRKLFEMMDEWSAVSFRMMYDEESDMIVFEKGLDIEMLLKEQFMKLEEMQASQFVKPIAATVSDFFRRLVRARDIVELWNDLQTQKLSLKPTLSYRNIERHLSEETSLYSEAQEALILVENKVAEDTSLQGVTSSAELLESLHQTHEKLEKARKGVKNYLANKRLSFARFFFVSDREIQKILFESDDIKNLYIHLNKCFPGIERLRISKSKRIRSVIGSYEEELTLDKIISIPDREEKWLIELEKELSSVVAKNIDQCYHYFNEDPLIDDILNYSSMAIVCALQLYCTSHVQNFLISSDTVSLQSFHKKHASFLSSLLNELKSHSTRRNRHTLTSVIVAVSNQEEIIRLLLERNIARETDFEWAAQLRYYQRDNEIQVSVFNTTIKYGYEYSYSEPIIKTALTDRCFRTLTEAYRYHLYGIVTGPTATGKTETVKALARALAVQFYLLSGNENFSYECMSQILKGLVSCGAWICIKSFDKLKSEILSAVTQNFIHISQAISANLTSMNFEGSMITVNSAGHICIVTNTTQSGRSDLPDNLKILFRTVTMLIPDFKRIIEIELFAAGFTEVQSLSLKLDVMYKTLSEQLLDRSYYNFAVWSVKAVLRTAATLKWNFPEEDESMLVLRSLIDINIPKLNDTQVPVFQHLLQDLFPDVNLHPPDYTVLLNALEKVCETRSLNLHDTFKLKIIQVFELIHVHHALMIVSDPFGGKTEVLRSLAEALLLLEREDISIGAKVKVETIVPMLASSKQLFGYFDEKSEWIDGLCSQILRSFAEDTSIDRKWLIFDGFVSSTWTDQLHTVLDQNRMLYLTSGEKIRLTNSTTVIFETMSIAETSPAIISRCGVVHIELRSIGWKPYVSAHIANNDIYKGYEKILQLLFDWSLDPCLQFLQKTCTSLIPTSETHLVMSTLSLFEMYLKDALEGAEEKANFAIWAQAALILAMVWGLAGNLSDESQIKFNAFCLSLWNGSNEEFPKPEAIKSYELVLPNEGMIQDNVYIFKGIGNWKSWADLLKGEKTQEASDCNRIFIQTVGTMKYSHVFLKHVRYRKPFILCGDTAVGKTCLIQDILNNKMPKGNTWNSFNFAFLTSAKKMQNLLLSKLNHIKRGYYGPSKNQFCINFVDDFNLNSIENEETGSVLEFIRQYFNYGHCYDVETPRKIFVHDVTFLLAITTGIKNGTVCPRFLRHFNIYKISTPTNDSIFRIYSNVFFANLKRNLFAVDVLNSVTSITNAAIDIYNSVIETLLPVPAKVQYCFNIRDISRVIDGCCLIQKESVETKLTFIRLWVHETWRVFADRISDNKDKEWLFLKIRETVKTHFKDSFETAFDYLPKHEGNQITKESFEDLSFGNFMSSDKVPKTKRYEEVNSASSLKDKVLSYLSECNRDSKKKMDIVVSRHTLQHLIKISRVLSTPAGNILMISPVGSGKRSVANLAAYIQQQTFFEPCVDSYYDLNIWRNDLKTVLRECGSLRKDLTFFLPDCQMKNAFACDVSCLLSTGEIPDLFSVEEKRDIIELTRLHAQGGNRNAEMSIRDVMNYFSEQCKNRLHFVLCFSSVSGFRRYLCTYPNLIKHCTINWYEAWPDDALLQIARKHIQDVKMEEYMIPNITKSCTKFYNDAKNTCIKYHQEIGRTTHVTSSAFLHMMKLYSHLMSKKQQEIVTTRNSYLTGLQKLELAAKQVEQMKATLTALKPQLESSAQQTAVTMKAVEQENVIVEKATTVVKEEEEIANKKAAIAGALKAECEADLAVAIPILEDAVLALNTLKPTDITLVKAMKNPPDTVKLVMAAVCVMLNVPPDRSVDPATGKKSVDYWGPSKRILGDMNFLQYLKEYDKDDIPASVMQVIKKTYMTDNSFMPHIVAKASSAAEGLCKWVRAMVSYDEVAKVVAPKKEKLAAAQKECDEAEAFLNEKRETLAALNAKLAALNNSLQETLKEKLKLENEVASCTNKLNKAESVMASLGDEKDRWMQCAESLRCNYDNLVGDMLLSCGVIAYMAPYSIMLRDEILGEWKNYLGEMKIPYSGEYNFVNILGVETDINFWYLSGLSKNRFSTENAIIMRNSEQWCLFVDSENQANQWIKTIEKKNDLKIIKLTDPDYLIILKQSIEDGTPVLLENVKNKLEIALNPILSKNLYEENGDWYLEIGKDTVQYSQNFRFYITTRLLNPSYSSDVFHRVTVIDFSIPSEALQDKLLDMVVSKEKPELQEKFEELVIQDATNRKVLKQQEENILSILSSNILEDETAIKMLDSSKNLSLDIRRKQKAAKLMAEEINKFRATYTRFAKHSAGLFGTLKALSNLNHMYRFSFSWFIQLYIRSIETSNRSVNLEKRLEFLKSSFTQNLYLSVCRSLFEKHKLLYSFLLCCKILMDDGQTTQEEIQFFITSDAKQIDDSVISAPTWVSKELWEEICKLSNTLEVFAALAEDFCSSSESWRRYCQSEPLRSELMPEPWKNKLTRFQKLILVKTVRPDKVVVEIMQLIESSMGDAYNYSPQLKISNSYAESNCLTPLIFILPSYSSPLSLLLGYASKIGYSSKFFSFSMGEGQEEKAEVLIKSTQKEGGWVFLQNCHLAASWMPKLEKICESYNASSISLDFRLWLSTYPTDQFPISILQNSVKITNDYPLDLKQSLLQAYQSEPIRNKEFFEGCPGKDKTFSKLLYGLCFFHAVVRERKYFGAQGWRIPYDFGHSDFQISAVQLQNVINESDHVPYDTLLYLIGECNYGGKITDNFDQSSLKHLLSTYCNANVVEDSEYTFSSDQNHTVPQRCEYRDIISHIEQLPADFSPQIFGSSANAVISRNTFIATDFLKSISLMNQTGLPLNEETTQRDVLSLMNDIAERLPDAFSISEIQERFPPTFLQPLNAALIYEAQVANDVLKAIKESFGDLTTAFRGRALLTARLEKLSKEIYDRKVPCLWKKTHSGIATTRLPSYIDVLLRRIEFLDNWISTGTVSTVCFELLSSCKTFLSAALLTFSRNHAVPVEQISCNFTVNELQRREDTYLIRGLYLFGARWDVDKCVLTESLANVFWEEMPPVCLHFTRNSVVRNDCYDCPLYIAANWRDCLCTKDLNNYVLSVPLETDVEVAHWVKCGTVLFCQID